MSEKRRNRSALSAFAVLASCALAPWAQAAQRGQASLSCESAISGWAATQIELADARTAYRGCHREQRSACTAAHSRIRMAEQRLRLMRG